MEGTSVRSEVCSHGQDLRIALRRRLPGHRSKSASGSLWEWPVTAPASCPSAPRVLVPWTAFMSVPGHAGGDKPAVTSILCPLGTPAYIGSCSVGDRNKMMQAFSTIYKSLRRT